MQVCLFGLGFLFRCVYQLSKTKCVGLKEESSRNSEMEFCGRQQNQKKNLMKKVKTVWGEYTVISTETRQQVLWGGLHWPGGSPPDGHTEPSF